MQAELARDWMLCVETEEEFRHNPLCNLNGNLRQALGEMSFSYSFLSYPDIDNAKTLSERIKMYMSTIGEGVEWTIHTEEFGDIKAEAWLPRFEAPLVFWNASRPRNCPSACSQKTSKVASVIAPQKGYLGRNDGP